MSTMNKKRNKYSEITKKVIIFFKRLKKDFKFIWRIVDFINERILYLLYVPQISKELERLRDPYVVKECYLARLLTEKDLDLLVEFFESLDKASFAYFQPHGFNPNSLKEILNNRAVLTLAIFKGDRIIGYFFARLFCNKKAFIGRIIYPDFRGEGLGMEMLYILHKIIGNIGFEGYATISEKNFASLKTYQKLSEAYVIDRLKNGELLVRFC